MAKELEIDQEAVSKAAHIAEPPLPGADKFVEDVIDELIRLSGNEKSSIS